MDLDAGSLIGTFGRWIVLLLGVAGLWEALAIVVAVNSVARLEELKRRGFAEWSLLGTLASVPIAIGKVVGVAVLL